MLRATDRIKTPRSNLPDLVGAAKQAHTSPGVRVFLRDMTGWKHIVRRRSPKDQAPSVGKPRTVIPTSLTRHTPTKTALRFPPRSSLGVFY